MVPRMLSPEAIKAAREALRKARSMAQASEATDAEIKFIVAKIDEAGIAIQSAVLAAEQAKAPPDRERLATELETSAKFLRAEFTGLHPIAADLDEAAAALRLSPVTAGEWQDISTAPKDGDIFYLADPVHGTQQGWWSDKRGGWWMVVGHGTQLHPTHWQPHPPIPLPPSPKEAGR